MVRARFGKRAGRGMRKGTINGVVLTEPRQPPFRKAAQRGAILQEAFILPGSRTFGGSFVRYERFAENVLGVLHLACCLILLRGL